MNRGILADTARIGLLTGCVKVAGLLKTVIVARSFGTGDTVDAYLMAFLIPAFAGDILAGAIAPSLMPVLADVKERQGRLAARELAAWVLGAAFALLVLVSMVAAFFAGPGLRVVASGFGAQKLELTRILLLSMLPVLPLSGLNATFRTMLNAEERFAIPALTPVVTPIAIVAAIWWLGGTWSARSLALGTVAGATIEVAALATAVWRMGMIVVPRRSSVHAIRRVLTEYLPAASGNLILCGSSVIDQALAATLGSGSISALSYGTRMVAVILSIGSVSLGTAALPRFSKLAALGEWPEIRRVLRGLAMLSLAITVPLTAVLALLSPTLARLVFQGGAFTAAATHLVGAVQAFSLLQIPFSVVLVLMVRVVSSVRANRLFLYLAVCSLIANYAFDRLLMRWWGVAGISLATSLVHLTGIAFLSLALFRTRPWSLINKLPDATPVNVVAH